MGLNLTSKSMTFSESTTNSDLIVQNQPPHAELEPVVINKLTNSMVWISNNGSRHIELMKFRMIRNIEKAMSSTKGITEFVRSKPIDCDIADFFKTFGNLDRYIYDKGKRPRGVDRYHIKAMYEDQFRDYFKCDIPSRVLAKDDVICKLSFPLILMYNDMECQAKLDMKYHVHSITSGHEIDIRKIKSCQDASTLAVKALKNLKHTAEENQPVPLQLETTHVAPNFDWGILE